jgi:hypothetical protein
MDARAFVYALVCVLACCVIACDRAQTHYPASTPPASLTPPTASPSPVPLPPRQAKIAIRAEQAWLNGGVYVVCLANDGTLSREMTSSAAAAHGWPVLRSGGRVRSICPVVGTADVLHALRAHDGTILFEAKVIPLAEPVESGTHTDGLSLQYCAPYTRTGTGATCELRPSAAGVLRNLGHDFFVPRGAT